MRFHYKRCGLFNIIPEATVDASALRTAKHMILLSWYICKVPENNKRTSFANKLSTKLGSIKNRSCYQQQQLPTQKNIKV